MTTSSGSTPLAVLGFTPDQERLYRLVLRHSGASLAELADLAGVPRAELAAQVAHVADLGLVQVHEDTVVALPPEQTLNRLISAERRRLRAVEDQLEVLHGLMPMLSAERLRAQTPRGEPVSVEAISGDEVVDLIRSLSPASTGDLLWMRPDQWRLAEGSATDAWAKELLRAGRRSRALYPARVLEEAPDVVRARGEAGELVRVMADVPWRMAVFGSTAALLRADPVGSSGPVLVIRQPGIIVALQLLFEMLWDRAMAVPGLDGNGEGRVDDRRLMVDLLARGAKDEQIARALGLSLRTVRRRVADVLAELGADSRFQAGAEAVRRGWV